MNSEQPISDANQHSESLATTQWPSAVCCLLANYSMWICEKTWNSYRGANPLWYVPSREALTFKFTRSWTHSFAPQKSSQFPLVPLTASMGIIRLHVGTRTSSKIPALWTWRPNNAAQIWWIHNPDPALARSFSHWNPANKTQTGGWVRDFKQVVSGAFRTGDGRDWKRVWPAKPFPGLRREHRWRQKGWNVIWGKRGDQLLIYT